MEYANENTDGKFGATLSALPEDARRDLREALAALEPVEFKRRLQDMSYESKSSLKHLLRALKAVE